MIFDSEFWIWPTSINGRKNIWIFRNVITLQIILRNEIPGNNDLSKVTCLNVKIKYGYQIKRKSSRINVTCSNTNLYYEPWHVRNPNIFLMHGIFRTLEYSKVQRYLDPCQTYCKVFQFPGYNYFCMTLLPRPF